MYTVQFKDEDFEIATATTTEEIRQLGQVGFVNRVPCSLGCRERVNL